ncbi:MAG TPA: 2,3,4,5-tetrahydropyridine-2,6-dicarboxylate N-succinyltransferase [Thermoanaerobaculia bacterium]|jgi:2,3,4,5-tetrahydropyridine-2-carboxylate N-succinyltransferase|nr:2,3,4,5-tetrahydropyridine-2,6-dicarboxylate N-succinyltransferase [Thermoanaerobaculia bacterium]
MITIEDRVNALKHTNDRLEAVKTINLFFAELEKGAARAAMRDDSGIWTAQPWVKEGILAAFRFGVLAEFASGALSFIDKDTIPARRFKITDGIRIVPGGSSVRRGAYIAKGVVMMPPAFVNVGAYVDADTMIDSHALVGSCAQIGKRVHLSAGAQIGGVLEPIGNVPVVIEDDVVVGGNCGIYEGTIVRPRAVIGAGVVLTGSTPVYDVVRGQVYRRTSERPLEIPFGAVVVPGSRPLKGAFAEQHQLSMATPLIVKYRDEKTDSATALEDALR